MPAATLLVAVTVLVGASQGIRTVAAATATLGIVVPKPYITGLTPSTIQAYGTAVITVSGGGFSSEDYTIQAVTIGRSPAASFTVDSPDMLTVVPPLLLHDTAACAPSRIHGLTRCIFYAMNLHTTMDLTGRDCVRNCVQIGFWTEE